MCRKSVAGAFGKYIHM